ncbi:hypothetical protein KP509_19G057500 [Ceratopteris richardii]|uniref:LysM domain-containing protein n=1 Tax=Ceratopteris richardii TaxID=49495 RepID=A0A8T2SMD6_CERRI|nr:hypothetical protein KP509_19G057500 [Ceratopteris richardii]
MARSKVSFGDLILLGLLLFLLLHVGGSECSKKMETRRMLIEPSDCPCREFYTVEEGETLQSISADCNAPFILLDNPHVQDADDVWPGLLLRLTCPSHVFLPLAR